MPDFTEHPTWVCGTNYHWSTKVSSSDGTKDYTVSFGFQPWPHEVQYDWSCTCPARTVCKHIKQVKASGARCGWNAEMEVTYDAARDANGDPCCPDCGGPVQVERVAV